MERMAAVQRLHCLSAVAELFHADAASGRRRGRRRSDWIDLGRGGRTFIGRVAAATVGRKRSCDCQLHLLFVAHLIEGCFVDWRLASVWHRVLCERGCYRPSKLRPLLVFLLVVIPTPLSAARCPAVIPRVLARDVRRRVNLATAGLARGRCPSKSQDLQHS